MRVNKIILNDNYCKSVGLEEIDISKRPLGSVVTLVGKNGSGKSRVLNAIAKLGDHISNEDLSNNFVTIPRDKVSSTNFHQYSKLFTKVVDFEKLKRIQDDLKANSGYKFPNLLNNSHLSSLRNIKPNTTLSIQEKNIVDEFSSLNRASTIEYFKNLSNKLIQLEFRLYTENRDHPELVKEKLEETPEYQTFLVFQKYVRQFLNKKFDFQNTSNNSSITSRLNLEGDEFNFNILSPGEKTLFAYAILFFFMEINSENNLSDCVIIIDEPELHLHPSAQINLILALKDLVNENGQLWIGTHSIPILSTMDVSEIFLMQESSIISPSRFTPGKALDELFEFETHLNRLSNFINSISYWSYANFMEQCFVNPESLFGSSSEDPQYKMFAEFISQNEIISVLDYGAGKGRIGEMVCNDSYLASKIEYDAYCYDKEDDIYLKAIKGINEILYEESEIESSKYDCVLLINVLHEIELEFWLSCMDTIKKSLKDDGYLLIMEDAQLPKGEKIGKHGYLILNTDQLSILFDTKEHVILKHENENYKERLQFIAIPKTEINPNNKTLKSAISAMQKEKMKNIQKLRSIDKDIKTGRIYANESQLYINSTLALKSMK